MTILEESLHLYFISISGFILFCRRNCRAIGLGGVYHCCCWASPCGIGDLNAVSGFLGIGCSHPGYRISWMFWPFGPLWAVSRVESATHVPWFFPADKLQWRFTCGFDFRHTLWLPFVAAFAVLKELRAEVAVRINHRKIRVLVSLFNEVGGLKYRSLIAVHSCVLLF